MRQGRKEGRGRRGRKGRPTDRDSLTDRQGVYIDQLISWTVTHIHTFTLTLSLSMSLPQPLPAPQNAL